MDKTRLICQVVETVAVCAAVAIIGWRLVSKIPETVNVRPETVKVSLNGNSITVTNAVLKISGELILK